MTRRLSDDFNRPAEFGHSRWQGRYRPVELLRLFGLWLLFAAWVGLMYGGYLLFGGFGAGLVGAGVALVVTLLYDRVS